MRTLRSTLVLAYLSILYGGCVTLLTDCSLSILYPQTLLDSKEQLFQNKRFYFVTFYTGLGLSLQSTSFLYMFMFDSVRNTQFAWKMSLETYCFLCYILPWAVTLASESLLNSTTTISLLRLAFNPFSATIITVALECLGIYQILRYMLLDELVAV